MNLHTIISGGQTGADHGALSAGKSLGLQTGGWMPKGFRTEAGPRPDFVELYGMKEHSARGYPQRTKANVLWGDATLVFGDPTSPGCRLTIRLCEQFNRPYHCALWTPTTTMSVSIRPTMLWLKSIDPGTLNVAGNREEYAPGITLACNMFVQSLVSWLRE